MVFVRLTQIEVRLPMLILPTLFLPLDKTGLSVDNLQTNEPRTAPVSANRLVRMKYGAFFTKDFELYSVDENGDSNLLEHGEQYRFVEFFNNTSAALGQEIYGGIIITAPELPVEFVVNYRALGGPENADNQAIAEALRNVYGAGYTIDYDRLIDVPDSFPPSYHYTDLATLYGFEYVTATFARVAEAINIRPYTQRALVLDKVRDMRLTYQVKLANFEQTLRNHTRSLDNPHQDTAAVLDLALIRNVGFKNITILGVDYEGYCSPSGTRNATSTVIGNKVREHIKLKNNPHQDSKNTLGLTNLIDLPVHTGYDSLTRGGYLSTYGITSDILYVGAYSVRSFVGEYTTRYSSEHLTAPLHIFYEASQIEILSDRNKLNDYNIKKSALNVKLLQIQNKRALIVDSSIKVKRNEIEYRLLNQNSCYAQLLKEMVDHRTGTVYKTQATKLEIPYKIRGLNFWLDFSDTTKMVLDSNNELVDRKIKSIADKTNASRRFSQSNDVARPTLTSSRDALVPSMPGLVKNKVAFFNQGVQHLIQESGPAFKINAGSTLVILSRTDEDNSTMYPLMLSSSNGNIAATDGVLIHGTDKKISITTDANSFKLNTPNQSTASGKYTLSIISIGENNTESWAATTVGSNSGNARIGIIDITTNPNGLILNQIGINKNSALQKGEIAEIMYYDQQLSLCEVKALVHYLSDKWSSVPFIMDFGYVHNAFSASFI